mgnify:CR=1 FL=1
MQPMPSALGCYKKPARSPLANWPRSGVGFVRCACHAAWSFTMTAPTLRETSPLAAETARGNFRPVLAWMRANVHEHGDRYTADEVIRRATGTALDTSAWFRHIDAKFS